VKGIDQRIADLPAEKLSLLLERLGRARAPEAEVPVIRPLQRGTDTRPLSFAQERLWFLDQLEPASSDYNVPLALRLRGALGVQAFMQALDEILRRHEVLRVGFRSVEGQPVATVAGSLRCAHAQADLRGLGERECEAEIRRLARSEALRPFDLGVAPLLRVRWLRCGAEDLVLLFTLHHIVCDGWSMRILVEEAAALYGAFAAGRPSPLAEPAFQYADFSDWQREYLQGARLEELLRFWKRQLCDAPRALALHQHAAAEPGGGRGAAAEPFEITRAAAALLLTLGREEGATPFMVLAALFGALLHAWSGQEDLCIGANAANRGQLEVERLIGFFINQVVLRIRPRRDGSFRDLLRQVRAVTSEAHAHQDLPFERLVEALGGERDGGQSQLFQAKLEFQNTDPAPLWIPGARLEELEAVTVPLRCDLSLIAAGSDAGITGTLSYDTRRVATETAQEMVWMLARIAELAAPAPELRLDELVARLSAERERRRNAERESLARRGMASLRSTRRKSVQI
jgi:hypothetical protein